MFRYLKIGSWVFNELVATYLIVTQQRRDFAMPTKQITH